VPRHRGTVVIAACLFLVACDPHLTDGIEARNETDVTVHFEVEADGERYPLPGEFDPGEGSLVISGSALGPDSLVTEDGCTTGDLVALDERGEEIGRHPPPLCDGDLFVVGP